ncbi:YdcF family protein [Microbaculum marinum]|uniref:YdcF family protein n=1 Tax=Microbaculum marinum TaxID=1764581 RepID=A0AAW9RMR4_9HYPH
MARIGPDNGTTEHTGPAADPAPVRRRSTSVRLGTIAVLGFLIGGVIAFAIGFAHFVESVAALERPRVSERADAIVALTGGAERITDAITLLGEGRARRLLISGVHPGTTRETLASLTPDHDGLFFCCVDLGHSALNTVGNAKEARDWARGNGFNTLIVVTASYHLPRSLNEISREMPEASLIPYPVVTGRVHIDNWWRNPGTTRLLLAEYTKYLMSLARLRLGGPSTSLDAEHAAIGG